MPSLPADDDSFALAAALHAAWQLADAELRSELERVMRDYVRRVPDFVKSRPKGWLWFLQRRLT